MELQKDKGVFFPFFLPLTVIDFKSNMSQSFE
jgi:hypothetical protein